MQSEEKSKATPKSLLVATIICEEDADLLRQDSLWSEPHF